MGTKRLTELLRVFLNRFPVGGFLHIVIDDYNCETWSIVWCLMHWKEFCNDNEELRWLEDHEKEIREMVTLLLDLSEEERKGTLMELSC